MIEDKRDVAADAASAMEEPAPSGVESTAVLPEPIFPTARDVAAAEPDRKLEA